MQLISCFIHALFLFIPLLATSQSTGEPLSVPAKQAVYIEFGGPAGCGSLNYEHDLFKKTSLKIALRAGIGSCCLKDFEGKLNPDLVIPLEVLLSYGKAGKLELGAGQAISSVVYSRALDESKIRKTEISTFFTLSYRYQWSNGLLIRIGYTPVMSANHYYHWCGFSLGYAF
jgi:hypothetical protein